MGLIGRLLSRRKLASIVVACLLAGTVQLGGAFSSADNEILDGWYSLFSRPASNDLLIVEIDERSLKQIDTWPWSRALFARVVDNLLSAGAEAIAIDIDFSSRSSIGGDRELEAVLKQGGDRVILPVFSQLRRSGEFGTGVLVDTGPLERFARHARLASVNFQPDDDGLVRLAFLGRQWSGAFLPSLPYALLGPRPRQPAGFLIDYSIDPGSIARISFADVLEGRHHPSLVEGRRVIIGAVAIELGDRLAVPVHRNLAGPVVLALVYETLLQDRALLRLAALPILGLVLLTAIVGGQLCFGRSWMVAGSLTVLLSVVLLAGSALAFSAAAIVLDVTATIVTAVLMFALSLAARIDQQAISIFRHAMSALHRATITMAVVDNSFDAVVVVDYRRLITIFNPVSETLFGRDAEDMVSHEVDRFLGCLTEDSSDARQAIDGLIAGRTTAFGPVEGYAIGEQGRVFPVALSGRRAELVRGNEREERRTDARFVHILTLRDITERKKAEEFQQKAMEDALNASRSKTEFLSVLSHELRTPLNAILGFSEIMKMQAFGKMENPTYLEYAGNIHDSGTHLLKIVDDVLDISRIEQGRLTLDEASVACTELLETARRMVLTQAGDRQVEIAITAPDASLHLFCDRRFILQVLVNILGNAVKFSEPGSTVDLAVRTDRARRITIVIADSGPGIPDAEQEMIFQPFYQASSRIAREAEGAGLGLPLAKSLVELHQGRIDLESRLGLGTRIACTFPPERTRLIAVEDQPRRTSTGSE